MSVADADTKMKIKLLDIEYIRKTPVTLGYAEVEVGKIALPGGFNGWIQLFCHGAEAG